MRKRTLKYIRLAILELTHHIHKNFSLFVLESRLWLLIPLKRENIRKMVIYFVNKRFKNNLVKIRFFIFSSSLFFAIRKDVSLQIIWSWRAHFHIILSPFIPQFFETLANILMAQRRKDNVILSFPAFIHSPLFQ